MYSLYTIRSIKVRWIPYQPKIMTAGSGVITDTLFLPSYSVFDSDDSGPTIPEEYLAHSYKVNDVCQVHSGEREHVRAVHNCTKILH